MKRPLLVVIAVAIGAGCLDLEPTVASAPRLREPPAGTGGTGAGGDSGGEAGGDAGSVSFARDIRPLINRPPTMTARGCVPCHDGRAEQHIGLDLGGLDVATLGKLREGGGTSAARIVIPFDPQGSALVQKLRGTYPYGTRMPKSGPPFWTEAEIQLVVEWIAQGARGADDE